MIYYGCGGSLIYVGLPDPVKRTGRAKYQRCLFVEAEVCCGVIILTLFCYYVKSLLFMTFTVISSIR